MKIKDVIKQQDKQMHLLCGALIAFFFGYIFNPLIGLLFAVLAGIGKEIYDKRTQTGTPELWDIVATAIGGAFSTLVLWIF